MKGYSKEYFLLIKPQIYYKQPLIYARFGYLRIGCGPRRQPPQTVAMFPVERYNILSGYSPELSSA